jgi:NAD(P)-dependent dehydrogenase (short-subunit alcohol dehydrogenase family)
LEDDNADRSRRKTALVTGSTAGIGFAIALGLARCNARVVLNGRTQGRVDEAMRRLKGEVDSSLVSGVAADLASADGCATLFKAKPWADILVNNLGVYGMEDFFETPDETWRRFFEVNVMAGVRASRFYLPKMIERGWGRIIFLSSEPGLNIPADMIHYGVTKTADLALSRGLAKRAAGTGVTVNAVLPGPTLSEGGCAMLQEEQAKSGRPVEEVAADFVKARRPSSIIRRAATAEEVANLVVYVASPLSSATTGAALRVDGGVVDTIA